MDIEQQHQSDSDDFEVIQPTKQAQKSSFFDGLCQGTKLSDKQKKMRQNLKKQSQMNTNQTTLKQKIQKTKHNVVKQNIFQGQEQNIAEEKILIDSNSSKSNKRNNEQQKAARQKSFEQLKLIRPLLKSVSEVGYVKPTPIQQLAIPLIMSGNDIVASSITGSGKTAAFLLPIIQRYYHAAAVGYIRTLIVTPTRQLAIQIHEQFQKLNKFTKLEACLVIGGSSIQRQQQLLRNNPEVVISTPGRIIDLVMNSRSIGIENLEMIVFDEADKLLELGFEAEIKQIMSHTHSQVQTILFSATISKEINKLATITSKKPIRISADPDNKTAEKLHQQIIKLKESTEEYREAVLISILSQVYKEKVIVFFKTKKQCHRIAIILGLLGLSACELHGNLSQTQRIQAFLDFKEGKYEYMLATDLAARGLDIKQVKTVVNFELPVQLTRYIHRIGRTARAGCVGTSLTLCNDDECLELKKMSRKTGDKLFKLNIKDETIKKMLSEISSLQRDIQNIVMQERQQRQIRLAEMQVKKAENMADHRDQIMSRPKRQWFMSEGDKKKIQDQAKKDLGLEPLNNTAFEKNKNGGRFGNNQRNGGRDNRGGKGGRGGRGGQRGGRFGNEQRGGRNDGRKFGRGDNQSRPPRRGGFKDKTKGIQKGRR